MLLIVENDARFAAKFKKSLKVEGLRNFFVESARDALFLLKSMKTHFILANLNAVESWEVLLDLKRAAVDQGIPLLFIEGFKAGKPLAERLKAEGHQATIGLPFKMAELTTRICSLRKDCDPLLGMKLGPPGQEVEILQKLGQGAMGAVYKAYQESLDRHVAVKFLAADYQAKEPESATRFRNEARAIAQMRSPHIVQVYFVGEHQQSPYMVMELIEGPTLDKYLRRKVPLKAKKALDLTVQILAGLEHAHQSGKIHRDIKPSNIMINKDGLAVILDFGLIREADGQNITQAGTVLGTPRYMAPEVIQGEPMDHRCDLYAAGIVLYEMVVGKAPFSGDDFVAVLMQHVNKPLPKPHTFGVHVEDELFSIIERLAAKKKTERYASAREGLEAIEIYLQKLEAGSSRMTGTATLSMVTKVDVRGGLAINETGQLIYQFGELPPDRAQSLHLIHSILSQLQSLDDLGEFERGSLKSDDTKMNLFSYFDGLAAIELEGPGLTSKFDRMTTAELSSFFEGKLRP